ncbi:ABC transporter ATP-binding protein [Bradyrhizobium sp. LHD-71]|uniref:ABC transporter ATP-binding protein n=1 Tax=Bradyrhizobium sp. LHD-71 TaxID=3072141 RepID=UPI00280D4856|nr:ABC transporter ATP-binding protein [Bradyrhizobium sp. LHD-71]MDQ8727976.1 ABC transporter ATP-binding protein [Bradyrhizobium sp. LHD-71]
MGETTRARPADVESSARPMLAVRDLHAWYGEQHVLHGVNFEVSTGEIVTLIGRNGAGRSTVLKSIMGLLHRRTGSITLEGREVLGLPSRTVARLGVGYVPEDRGIYTTLTVEENLFLPPEVRKPEFSVRQILEMFPNIRERLASGASKLSGGEQQMLAIGRVLRTGARLLLLDEPTEGLAPVIVEQIGRAVTLLKQAGLTVILVEQNFNFAAAVADRHYVIEQGHVVDMIPNAERDQHAAKLQKYLGI